jgi:hypothetical protein
VLGLEYRDDSVYNKIQKAAKAIYVKETPFAVTEKIAAPTTTHPDGTKMTEKEMRIAQLKARLLAPAPIIKRNTDNPNRTQEFTPLKMDETDD